MKINLSIILCCLLSIPGAFSQTTPLDAASIARVKKGVEEAALRTSTIVAGFTQEKEMSILEEKMRSTGRFYFKKDKQLRWEYTKPYSYIIIINNDRITIKDEQKTNSFDTRSNKVFGEINKIIVGSIRGTLLNDPQNFRTSYYNSSAAWIVKLVPLSAALKSSLKEITLHFDKKDFSVNRVEMTENTGDKTVIIFTDKKFNQPVANEKFILR